MLRNEISLIDEIKTNQNSCATEQLINQYTGLYISIVNRFSYLNPVDRREMEDRRPSNIYQYAMDYDKSKNTQFNTYLTNRITWDCQNLYHREVPQEEATEDNIGLDENFSNSLFSEVERIAKANADVRFIKIFKMRHDGKPAQWWKIGEELGLSPEGARQIYNKNIKIVKKILKEEVL